ncbi:hypothetical protein GTQ40_07470 [Flavobacteriaceae bacterium R38]|nr:hypothetical protein [Flavobacteriaceae bacterium R38]
MKVEKDITNKIEQLTEKERKLVFMKLKQLVNKNKQAGTSDKLKRLTAYVEAKDYALDLENLKLYLKESLPDYMIPSNINIVEEIPQLPNGKVDLNALATISKTEQESKTGIEKPKTEIEEKLVTIWEEVLDFSPLSIHDNFFEIGGDSILSIQIIARARKLGIEISPNQLFEHQTISELALFIDDNNTIDTDNDDDIFTGEIPLSPIQHWFFETYVSAPHFWNQGVKIQDIPAGKREAIESAIDTLIIEQEALRLSFYHNQEGWKAKVLSPEHIKAFDFYDISSLDITEQESFIEKTLHEVQSQFNLAEGSLFKCLFFKTSSKGKDVCILISHHLVVDAVSWKIIQDHVISAIEGNKNDSFKTTSLKKWNTYLNEELDIETWKKDIDFWNAQNSVSNMTIPSDFNFELPLREKSIETIAFKLDQDITNKLTQEANSVYNTKIDELILTALTDSISKWSKSDRVRLGLERHGRETANTSFDLSNTVGWLTAYFPLSIKNEYGNDYGEKIKSVKEQIRNIPNGGLSYPVLRYLKKHIDVASIADDSPQVLFNFLGKQSNTNKGELVITNISENSKDAESERYYLLEINSYIKDNQLMVNWSYSNTVHKRTTIEILIEYFEKALIEIVMHCSKEGENTQYTPSDFPEAQLNQDELDNLLNELDLD